MKVLQILPKLLKTIINQPEIDSSITKLKKESDVNVGLYLDENHVNDVKSQIKHQEQDFRQDIIQH